MTFNFYDAIVAGLWASSALMVVKIIAMAVGWSHIDFSRMLGGIFLPLGRKATMLGLTMHYVLDLGFGLAYAAIFAYLAMGPDELVMATILGALFGLYHWVIEMGLMSFARTFNPHIKRGEEVDPGIWGIRFGPAEAVVRIFAHLAFGATFGFAYFVVALLNGTANGTAVAGNGLGILLALVPAALLFYLYATWLHAPELERKGYVFEAALPSVAEERERARHELRQRYERGELALAEYEHLRQQYSAEP